MWKGEWVDDALAEILNDGIEAANVVKGDGDLGGTDNLHCDGLFVGAQGERFLLRCRLSPPSGPSGVGVGILVVVVEILILVLLILGLLSVVVGEDGLQAGAGREGFLLRFGLGAGVGIEASENLAGDEVQEDGLGFMKACVSAGMLHVV